MVIAWSWLKNDKGNDDDDDDDNDDNDDDLKANVLLRSKHSNNAMVLEDQIV